MQEEIINNIRFRPTGIRNYWISENGDIINRDNKDALLKPFVTNDNHLRIELKVAPGVPKKFFIHRLVHKVFNEEELIDGMVVEHLDSNPTNNHYSNLKQSTQKENINTAIENRSFGFSRMEPMEVYDKKTDTYLYFDSISDFSLYTKINCDSKTKLHKYKKFKDRYELVW